MATKQAIADFILNKLHHPGHFSVRSMFGEFVLYANSKTVAFICDNLLYVKILPASQELESQCEKAQLSTLPNLPSILFAIAEATPAKKKKARK